MMKKLWSMDGPVWNFLEKCGQLIVLSALWLLCCLPVVTFCSSCGALYQAVTLSVRGGQGNGATVFFRSFRENLLRGGGLSVILIGILVLLEGMSIYLMHSVFPSGVVCVLMILDLFALLYAGPVSARFRLGILQTLKLSFVLSLQFAHYTFVFLFGSLCLAALQIFVFPMAVILILPGVWCLGISFLMEKALNRYAGERDETDEDEKRM